MNQMPLRQLTDGARLRLPTRRAAAKERTRGELLASARRLFTEKGYERATIRDIASGAGKSTGAVFASFSDKSDLFNAIVLDNRNALYEAMRGVAHGVPGASQSVEAVLLELFEVAFRIHLRDLALWQATISASWSPQLGAAVRARLASRPLTQLIADVLEAGVARGELSASTDLALVSQMLWDGYLASYRHAAFDGWDLEALKALMKAQIDVILGGLRMRAAAASPS
jgi:AcrR family transcriptional regulator